MNLQAFTNIIQEKREWNLNLKLNSKILVVIVAHELEFVIVLLIWLISKVPGTVLLGNLVFYVVPEVH
jgi:hypothetical protein